MHKRRHEIKLYAECEALTSLSLPYSPSLPSPLLPLEVGPLVHLHKTYLILLETSGTHFNHYPSTYILYPQ